MDKRVTRREFLKIAGLSSGTLILTACGAEQVLSTPEAAQPTPTAQVAETGPRAGGTLLMGIVGTPAHFDPATFAGDAGYVIRRAYNFLVRLGHDLKPYPDLAKSWETPDNGQTWVFQLNEGVEFHHGTKFTAEDVIYTFERIMDPDTGSAGAAILSGVTGFDTNGDYELTVNLDAPDADFPVKTGSYQFPILAHDFAEDRLSTETSGTGPYRLVDFVPGEKAVMERFENYWEEGLPYIEGVEILTIPEDATRANALLAGQVDLLPALSNEFVPQLEAAEDIRVGFSLSGGMSLIYMRSDKPPFDDNRVRMAAKLTLDREGLLRTVQGGIGDISNDNPLAKGNPWYVDTGMKERDVEQATQLLAEAGYPDGLETDMYVPGGSPGLLELAVAAQEMARPAGFQFNVVVIPKDVFWNEYWLEQDFGVDGWSLRGTADEQLRIAYSCGAAWNESHWCNEEFDALLDEARGTADETRRKELYADIQRIFVDEGGSAIPFHTPKIAAFVEDLQGYEVHPMGLWDDPRLIWLDR